jgi:shikimate dehydrogenase
LESKSFAVLGSPIEHSKSPAIHAAAYRALGLDWSYSRFQLETAGLAEFLRNTDLSGASLTMPLKDEAFKLVETDDPNAIAAQAVNTIVRSGAGWQGFNTDVFGITQALAGVQFEDALIIGSGATARNAVLAVKLLNPDAKVSVLARNNSKANEVVAFAQSNGLVSQVTQAPVNTGNFELTISTLPPSAKATEWLAGETNGTLFDVAYNPWPSELAKQWSGNLVSGIEMLIWQAIAQIRIFSTGSAAEPLENEDHVAALMREAAEG